MIDEETRRKRRVRRRMSYQEVEFLLDEIEKIDKTSISILRFLFKVLNDYRVFGNKTKSMYFKESLNLLLEDRCLINPPSTITNNISYNEKEDMINIKVKMLPGDPVEFKRPPDSYSAHYVSKQEFTRKGTIVKIIMTNDKTKYFIRPHGQHPGNDHLLEFEQDKLRLNGIGSFNGKILELINL